jgi:hypothetical protein
MAEALSRIGGAVADSRFQNRLAKRFATGLWTPDTTSKEAQKMKRTRASVTVLLTTLTLSAAASAAPPAFQAAIQASNPVLYYKFNETSGTTATNAGSLGSTHDGTYNGAPTLGVPTQAGDTGITFNGQNDFVESAGVAPASLTGNPSFTAETVVRIPFGATAQFWPPFLHWGSGLTGKEVYFSLQHNNNDIVYAGFYNGGLRSVDTIALGRWHHIVMVRQGGGTDQVGTTLFIDGVSVATEADGDLPNNGTTPDVTATTFRVNRAVDFVRFFTGSMDELALYDRALTNNEVVAHFQAFPELGNEDGGDIPSDAPKGPVTKCETVVGKGVAKLAVGIGVCHAKRAALKITDDGGEEACETAAAAKFGTTKTTGCASCTDFATIAKTTERIVDTDVNAAVYCNAGTPFGADDGGNLPSDAPNGAVTKCEGIVAKAAGKLIGAIVKCHASRVKGKLADEAAEEACEQAATTKFGATKTTGCGGCTNLANIAQIIESDIDSSNSMIYCDSD